MTIASDVKLDKLEQKIAFWRLNLLANRAGYAVEPAYHEGMARIDAQVSMLDAVIEFITNG